MTVFRCLSAGLKIRHTVWLLPISGASFSKEFARARYASSDESGDAMMSQVPLFKIDCSQVLCMK